MSRLISFAVLIAIIIFIGLIFYKVLVGFFVPVFLASVLVVVFRPLHNWVLGKTGQRERLAAALTTLLIVMVLVFPIALIGSAAAVQGLRLVKDNDASVVSLRFETLRTALGLEPPPYDETIHLVGDEIAEIVRNTDDSLLDETNDRLVRIGARLASRLEKLQLEVNRLQGPQFDEQFELLIDQARTVGQPTEIPYGASKTAVALKSEFGHLKAELLGGQFKSLAPEYANPSQDDIEDIMTTAIDYVRPRLLSITGATGAFVIKLAFGSVILIVAIFFFLYDGPAMVRSIMYLSPLDDAYEQELLLEFDRISRAVVLATVLSALAQGITAGIGYYFAGMNYLFLLLLLTTAFAMVPFVGPAVIWVPVCLYIGVYDGRPIAATVLAVWGVAVVGTVDNLVKAFVLPGQTQLHPLLALLSVLGGVQTLGPVGIVVGPMVVAMLQTLLSILQRELVHFDRDKVVLSTGPIGGDIAKPFTVTDDQPSSKKTEDSEQDSSSSQTKDDASDD